MVELRAQFQVVAVPEPKDIHGLRLVMDAQTRAQSGQMGLDGTDADVKPTRGTQVATCT